MVSRVRSSGNPVDPSAVAESSKSTKTDATSNKAADFEAVLKSAAGSTSSAEASQAKSVASQLAADLRAGKITPDQVMDKLVASTMESPMVKALEAPQRAELEKLLRQTLQDNPTLSELTKRLED